MVYSNLIALQIILLTEKKSLKILSAKAKFVLRENVSPTDDLYICDESSMISDVSNFSSDLEFGSGDLLADLFTFVGQRKLILLEIMVSLPQ